MSIPNNLLEFLVEVLSSNRNVEIEFQTEKMPSNEEIEYMNEKLNAGISDGTSMVVSSSWCNTCAMSTFMDDVPTPYLLENMSLKRLWKKLQHTRKDEIVDFYSGFFVEYDENLDIIELSELINIKYIDKDEKIFFTDSNGNMIDRLFFNLHGVKKYQRFQ